MTAVESRLARNLHAVNERLRAACLRAGRPVSDVTLIAVTKYAELDWVRALVDLGVHHLGESRPQQLAARVEALAPAPLTWHMIGHLQRNKARRTLQSATWIHSVDSLRLLETLDQLAGELSVEPKLLVEVNLSGEATKGGFSADELRRSWPQICAVRNVRIDGLMTMAALSDDPEEARPTFAGLRQLRDELLHLSPQGWTLGELSMGMTNDFEVAIEEGATFVRIGSALFEGLESAATS